LSFDCRAIVELDARRQLQWDLKKARCERRFRFCSVGTEGALLTEKQSTEVKGALIKVAVMDRELRLENTHEAIIGIT
jgi:hypothetical protein